MAMNFDNFCKVYGLDPEIAGKIPCPIIENEQAGIKIQIIDWCGVMQRYLESIEHSFVKVPVDQDAYKLQIMQNSRDHMKKSLLEIEQVLSTIKGK